MLISNLLDTKNYPKLMPWSKGIGSNLLEGLSLVDKEVNELVNIAEHSNAATVFAKLFSEDQKKGSSIVCTFKRRTERIIKCSE